MERIRGLSPSFKARTAGVLYLLSVLTAVFAEFVAHGRLGLAAVFVPVVGYVAVTLILLSIFMPVNKYISWLATACGLVGLGFEALQWRPGQVNPGMIFHAFYCVLIGYLMIRSAFLPRILGALMGLAGLLWLTYLSPQLVHKLSPHLTAVGILAEGLPMLWLLLMGVHVEHWSGPARIAEEWQ
jgi:Domain of unknown function (DUF4386)